MAAPSNRNFFPLLSPATLTLIQLFTPTLFTVFGARECKNIFFVGQKRAFSTSFCAGAEREVFFLPLLCTFFRVSKRNQCAHDFSFRLSRWKLFFCASLAERQRGELVQARLVMTVMMMATKSNYSERYAAPHSTARKIECLPQKFTYKHMRRRATEREREKLFRIMKEKKSFAMETLDHVHG
jgi:hypothetical protein